MDGNAKEFLTSFELLWEISILIGGEKKPPTPLYHANRRHYNMPDEGQNECNCGAVEIRRMVI